MRSTLNKSLVVLSGRIIEVLFAVGTTFILTRELGINVYGRFIYLQTICFFLSVMIKLGLDQACIRFFPEFRVNGNYEGIRSLFTFVIMLPLVMALFLSGVVYIIHNVLGGLLTDKIELGMLLVFPATIMLVDLFQGIYIGLDEIKSYVLIKRIIMPIARVLILCFFVLSSSLSFFNAVIVHALVNIIISLILYSHASQKIGISRRFSFKPMKVKPILAYSLQMLLSSFFIIIINKLDVFMLGLLSSNSNVGVYSVASQIALVSSFLVVATNTAISSIVSEKVSKGEYSELINTYKNITTFQVVVGLVIFNGLMLFGNDILNIFSIEGSLGLRVLLALSIGQLFIACAGPAHYLTSLGGKPVYELSSNITVGIVNIVLNYFFISKYGAYGAAVATTVSFSIGAIWKSVCLRKMYRVNSITNFNNKKVVCTIISQMLIFKFVLIAFKSLVVGIIVFGLTNILMLLALYKADLLKLRNEGV